MTESLWQCPDCHAVQPEPGGCGRCPGITKPKASGSLCQGRRIPDGEWFNRTREAGDYGAMEVEGQGYRWFNRPPNAEPGDPDNVLNENHVVILEMDGSITVHASIENRVYHSEQIGGHGPIATSTRPWHGHLERGVWRES